MNFKRKNLILLSEPSEEAYNAVYPLIKAFQKKYPDTNIAFSANAGEHGGFITDSARTWALWKTDNYE